MELLALFLFFSVGQWDQTSTGIPSIFSLISKPQNVISTLSSNMNCHKYDNKGRTKSLLVVKEFVLEFYFDHEFCLCSKTSIGITQ